MPRDEDDFLNALETQFEGLEKVETLAVLMQSTTQGRAIRRSREAERVASYEAALSDAVRKLPVGDQRLATAALYSLHASAWLELREAWGLDAQQMARASLWAIKTLLKDLRARNGLPLDIILDADPDASPAVSSVDVADRDIVRVRTPRADRWRVRRNVR